MKTILLFFSLFLFGPTLFSQTIFFKIGTSFSKLTWYNSMIGKKPFNKGIVGLNAMAGVNYLNYKYFYLSSNVGFIQKGGSQNVIITDNVGDSIGTTKETEKLNYLTINTTFNLKIPIKKVIEPYLFAGPRLDYLITYKENFGLLKQFDDIGKLNKFSYGLLLGGGVNCNIKKFRFGIALDYYLNINKQINYTSNGFTNKLFDNTFAINALFGYKF